jgi:hypothetical protein
VTSADQRGLEGGLAVARLVDNTPYHLRQWGIWADLDMGGFPQVPDVVDRWTTGGPVEYMLEVIAPYYYSVRSTFLVIWLTRTGPLSALRGGVLPREGGRLPVATRDTGESGCVGGCTTAESLVWYNITTTTNYYVRTVRTVAAQPGLCQVCVTRTTGPHLSASQPGAIPPCGCHLPPEPKKSKGKAEKMDVSLDVF